MLVKQLILRTFVLGAVAASTTLAAKADPLNFTLTGQGTDITFTLNSSPTVSASGQNDFVLDSVSLDVNGHHETDNLEFFTSHDDGGFAAYSGYTVLLDLFGSQLFSGTTAHPTFDTGTYILDSQSQDYSYCNQGGDYKLTIVDPSAVTPEPSSILLLATGMLTLLGAAVTKRFV